MRDPVERPKLFANDVIRLIKDCELHSDQYIVVGGAVLAVHGLRHTFDVDIVASEYLIQKCLSNGWTPDVRKDGKPMLKNGAVEMYADVNSGNFNPTLDELLARAIVFKGIPFCSMEDVKKFKQEYNRDKDVQDILLINTYLKIRDEK
jgi:hypothetical protein